MVVVAFVRTLRGSTLCLTLGNAEDIAQAVSAAEGIPLDALVLRTAADSKAPSAALFVRVGLRICGGKQGAFGQNLRRAKAKRKTRNFDACRTLDGRRLGQVKREEQLAQWVARQEERRAREAEEAQHKQEERRQRAAAIVANALAAVDRDAATVMADAVREGLRSSKRPRDTESAPVVVAAAAAAAADVREEGKDKKRRIAAWEAFDAEITADYSDATETAEEEDTEESTAMRRRGIAKHEHALLLVERSPYGAETPWVCDGCEKRGFGPAYHCPDASCSGFDLCRACYESSLDQPHQQTPSETADRGSGACN